MDRIWAPWRMKYILEEAENPSDTCIFCEFPKEQEDEKNLIAYRSKKCFVILNKFPYNNAHVMVVPYQHTGDLLKLEDDVLLDMQQTIQKTVNVLNHAVHPHAFNIGMNLGRLAGAGIDKHLHYHIVPRWDGDTSYMTVISDVKIISESLVATWERLSKEFKRLYNI